VPGGLGTQEISHVAIGSLFGMPAHMSLGVPLIRRARHHHLRRAGGAYLAGGGRAQAANLPTATGLKSAPVQPDGSWQPPQLRGVKSRS